MANREINTIILHITANGNGKTGQELIKYIDNIHKANGWGGIGYHWVIDKEGNILQGRDENKIGAHCKGRNTGSIGISYDSRGDDKTSYAPFGKFMTNAQKDSFIKLVKDKMQEFNIPIENVHGHNYYDKGKACPCFNVEKDAEFRKLIVL